jgi:hypothetical protein
MAKMMLARSRKTADHLFSKHFKINLGFRYEIEKKIPVSCNNILPFLFDLRSSLSPFRGLSKHTKRVFFRGRRKKISPEKRTNLVTR